MMISLCDIRYKVFVVLFGILLGFLLELVKII